MVTKLKGGGVRLMFATPNEVPSRCLRDEFVVIRIAIRREKWSKADNTASEVSLSIPSISCGGSSQGDLPMDNSRVS